MSGVPFCAAKASGKSVASMLDAARIMPSPRSAKILGGFVMLVRAACSSDGTPDSLPMSRRMRTGAGSFSIVMRLCTPSDNALAYVIGLRFQFASVSCSSSHPSITPARMRLSTRSSGVSDESLNAASSAAAVFSVAISAAIACAEKSSSRSS